MDHWKPVGEGANFALGRIMQPLTPFKNDLLIVSGLADHNGNALGDGGGDHARAGGSFLTSSHPKKTGGADIHAGIRSIRSLPTSSARAPNYPLWSLA
jgi:hypothetical protein